MVVLVPGRPARSVASRLSRVVAAAVLIATMVLVGASAVTPLGVAAADGCGSGWHKQSDGKLAAAQTNASGRWSARATLSGWVRYCTRERFLVDQKNQRVYVGIPTQILTRGTFAGGGRTRECLTTRITINAKHIPSGSSISIGFSGKTPTGSVSTSTTSTSKTTTYRFCASTPRTTTTLENTIVGVRATVPNCSVLAAFAPVITSVTIGVTATMTFKSGTTEGSRTAVATNTDKSTWSNFSC